MSGVFRFAFIGETFLYDHTVFVREAISVRREGLDCLIHGGNFIGGANPEGVTRRLLRSEFARYAACADVFLPVQGERDGWRNERYAGQLAKNIMTDEAWREDTAFLERNKTLSRPDGKPYYYMDFPAKSVRVVILCGYRYEMDSEAELYEKYRFLGVEQLRWLDEEALRVPAGDTVVLVSHNIPKSRFETGEDPFIYHGFSTEPSLAILQRAQARGANIALWLTGGYGRDEALRSAGINVVSRNMGDGSAFDVIEVNVNARRVRLVRSDGGAEEELEY